MTTILQGMARGWTWAREAAARPGTRRVLLAVGAAAFVAMTFASFRALPEGLDPNLWLIAPLVLVTAPLTVLANASEYRLLGAVLGHGIALRQALRVSLLATIANYLPAPGGVAVRTAALRREGSSVGAALAVNAAAALIWLGATGVIAGGALLAAGELQGVAVAGIVGGLAAIVASVVVLRQRGPTGGQRFLAHLVAVEVGVVLVSGTRTYLALRAIGAPVSVGAAFGISGATVIAAAIGIAPGGLGLREALAAAIAPVLLVPAASAVAATAVDRVASQVGVLLTAAVAGVHRSDLTSPPQAER